MKKRRKTPFYIISLIEHKSQVDYNVVMQLLRYMVCIWTDYEKECDRIKEGSSAGKTFRYPPVLPIVYYEGTGKWTADRYLSDRILLQEMFKEFIPDFTYRVVRLHDYSNEELLSREDEMSLLMLINKIQSAEDFEEFARLSQEKVEQIVEKTPAHVLEIIAKTIWSLCMKMNVPQEEAKQYVEKVKERQMGYLFENMEKIDIQKERRKTAKERRQREQAERQAEQAQIKIAKMEHKLQEAEKRNQKERQEVLQNTVKTIVSLCQKFGATKETAMTQVMESCGLLQEEAKEKVEFYWKE